ncbi:RIP metalloprotease RseP [Thiocystis violascens]|uniref:Zinc metalloprotease n=1 Tax=Thiocystis violascens (strain ATCC 17096 / DSM 198 / 6111) TaxID=765911 RepID=I3YCF2_THIV6|nr:RIP metalloprotease RseP [Thiocystis violascens]AFL74670.1 RIP metalloprotease RseP [Thiocystis violascens DSM 198]
MEILFTIASFVVALAILIAVHEFGHFWVARRVGVKVLRFSIGFGRPLLRWQSRRDETEYVLAAIPLGGYVKMLDEREEAVPENQLDRAFNRQPLWKRSAIVVAGPLFNLLFAILAYWAIFIVGDTGLKPVIGVVAPQSIAAASGFQPGDELLRIGDRPARSWETAVFAFAVEAMDGQDLPIRVRDAGGREQDRWLPGEAIAGLAEEPDLLGRLGLEARRPRLPPIIGELVPGEPAQRAGLEVGDRLVAADGIAIDSWQDWVALVRERAGQSIPIEVERGDGSLQEISITPRSTEIDGREVGRIGAGVLVPDDLMDDYRVLVRYGPIEALGQAVDKTLDTSVTMLRVIGRMLIGEASVRNLSGPITIAEVAGQTASSGLLAFVKFLAVVSISLGVLNLLPIPVLDGGHLFYFLIEWIKGSPVSEQIQLQGQKVGFILLAALMSLAFYVDISRLLG